MSSDREVSISAQPHSFRAVSTRGKVKCVKGEDGWLWEISGEYGSSSFKTKNFDLEEDVTPKTIERELILASAGKNAQGAQEPGLAEKYMSWGEPAIALVALLGGQDLVGTSYSRNDLTGSGERGFEWMSEIHKTFYGGVPQPSGVIKASKKGLEYLVSKGMLVPFNDEKCDTMDMISFLKLALLMDKNEELLSFIKQCAILSGKWSEKWDGLDDSTFRYVADQLTTNFYPEDHFAATKAMRYLAPKRKTGNEDKEPHLNLAVHVDTALTRLVSRSGRNSKGGELLLKRAKERAEAVGKAGGESFGKMSYLSFVSSCSFNDEIMAEDIVSTGRAVGVEEEWELYVSRESTLKYIEAVLLTGTSPMAKCWDALEGALERAFVETWALKEVMAGTSSKRAKKRI